ncbi:MAG: DUF1501 domain-containing protein [Pirellulales bacterium]|nr:DUF1501 domain-containing protein [Pirellulales bacterium]
MRPSPLPSQHAFSRRRLMQIGGLGLWGLNLPAWLRAAESNPSLALATGRPPIKACIVVFFYGGPSHLDTWDMKPDAPAEVRGEFRSIDTVVPGISVCEHLPRMAGVMDKVALVRSLHHPMRNHNAAAVEALCGRTPAGGDQELLADDAQAFPCYGSVWHYLDRATPRDLHHVALPHVMYNVVKLPGQIAGFLGPKYNPFHIEADPTAANFRVSELSLPASMNAARLADRKSLLDVVDRQLDAHRAGRETASLSTYYERALALLESPRVRQGFDLSQESEQTRDRYGRHVLGQSLLLARRLVESGVPFVTVYDKVRNGQDVNWDSHAKNFERHREHLLPPADEGLSALLEDLSQRGLLDSTLVLALGEFGRTPKINTSGGRDHWPDCFTALLAGGGVRGGQTYGTSDKIGAYPDLDPVTPGDLAATLFWRFGFDPRTLVHDLSNRPFHVAEGQPLASLFG